MDKMPERRDASTSTVLVYRHTNTETGERSYRTTENKELYGVATKVERISKLQVSDFFCELIVFAFETFEAAKGFRIGTAFSEDIYRVEEEARIEDGFSVILGKRDVFPNTGQITVVDFRPEGGLRYIADGYRTKARELYDDPYGVEVSERAQVSLGSDLKTGWVRAWVRIEDEEIPWEFQQAIRDQLFRRRRHAA